MQKLIIALLCAALKSVNWDHVRAAIPEFIKEKTDGVTEEALLAILSMLESLDYDKLVDAADDFIKDKFDGVAEAVLLSLVAVIAEATSPPAGA